MSNLKTVSHDVNVCVVGGGLAGLCAAVSAARHGSKVAIMQDRPMFGGNASSEVRMWLCGAQGKDCRESGIVEEIEMDNLYRNPERNYSIWDSILFEKIYIDNLPLPHRCKYILKFVKSHRRLETSQSSKRRFDCRFTTNIHPSCWW